MCEILPVDVSPLIVFHLGSILNLNTYRAMGKTEYVVYNVAFFSFLSIQ